MSKPEKNPKRTRWQRLVTLSVLAYLTLPHLASEILRIAPKGMKGKSTGLREIPYILEKEHYLSFGYTNLKQTFWLKTTT